MKITPETKKHHLTVYIPDTRGVSISRFGKGNLKIGQDGVYTYSRLPGSSEAPPLGTDETFPPQLRGTCPGATEECQAICYASRPVAERGLVFSMWTRNSMSEDVPQELPPDAKIVRIHVSGDFTSLRYIAGWYDLISKYPNVRFFGYTRSWRVPELRVALEELRTLPNVQLFASMDKSTQEEPPAGWRAAWINDDDRLANYDGVQWVAAAPDVQVSRNQIVLLESQLEDPTGATRLSYVCPEETGHKPNCEACRYCIDGKRGDVTFLKH